MSDNDSGRDDLARDQAAPGPPADPSKTADIVFDETRLRTTAPADDDADDGVSEPGPDEPEATEVTETAETPQDRANGAPEKEASEAADAADEDEGAEPEGKDEEKAAAGGGGEPRRRRKVLRRVAFSLVVVMLLGGAGAAWLYHDLVGGIRTKHVTDQLGTDRPRKLNKSLNILLIGSDTREGENARYGGAGEIAGARSDTAILLHLSPNRDQAVGISFPRDSMVKIPECEKEKGGTAPARFGMLNTAFAFAGATCTWKTLESLTGIHIDHFVQVDFSGFKRMVDALGGVEICVDKPVNDPRAELYLKAGKQTVKGNQALGYVRARYSLGNGSDLERIERQQKFMAAVVDKATSGRVLTDPAKTYKFLKAATKSVTTDDELDLSAMRKLADGLKGMSAGQVRFVTVPVERYAPDPNRVQWNEDLARPLFDAIRHDNDLPAEPAGPVQAKQAPPPPGKVSVTVVAAGGRPELVKRVVKQLRQRGFTVAKKVEKGAVVPESRIVFAPSAEAQASALARDVPDALLTPDAGAPASSVRLVIGRNGLRLAPPAINKIGGGIKGGQKLCD
ncbi:LytR family transcriptional regulator [Actinomadura sp. KC216]|uniref:LCP family protein n=1 Tax=Actinomadura sp. KC216 TaxID=2530370 RepID=UPI001048F225|nr:LCP family protein [Actinomadura sp. KC216]TDB86753.1 LytR family transcriptional regulator [Actinomadura sp. KC216]